MFLESVIFSRQRLGDALLPGRREGGHGGISRYQDLAIKLLRSIVNFRWQELLTFTHQRIGDVPCTTRISPVRRRSFVPVVDVRGGAHQDPSNSSSLYDVANAREDWRRWQQGDPTAASKDIRRRSDHGLLVATRVERHLAKDHGDQLSADRLILRMQGDAAGALAQFQQCAAIRAKRTACPRALAGGCRRGLSAAGRRARGVPPP